MNCLECQELLQRRLDEGSIPTSPDLDGHLAGCQACRHNHLAAQALLDGVRATPQVALPDNFAERMVVAVLRDRMLRQQRMQTRLRITMAMAAAIAWHRLNGEEREPSFPAQSLHDVDGGDIDIALRAAVVRLAGEDGWNVPIQRLIVERLAPADLMGVAAEPGGELMIHGLSFLGLGFRAAERRAETLPVGETGGATGVGGFAGNRLHGTRSVEEAGRKPLRRALGAAPQATR